MPSAHPSRAARPFATLPAAVDLPATVGRSVPSVAARATCSAQPRPAQPTARLGRSTRARPPPTDARHAPRRGARLQGRLPALQDDEGLPRRRARPAGTATACPWSSPSRRSSASPASRTSRPTASPSSTPGAASRCSATSTRSTRLTERMGYWVDYGQRLLDDGPGLHRVGVVVAQADLRQGPARRGLPRRAVLPALRHRAVRPRGGAGLRDRSRPVGLRALPADQRDRSPAERRPARLDDDAVDAGVQHRRARCIPT